MIVDLCTQLVIAVQCTADFLCNDLCTRIADGAADRDRSSESPVNLQDSAHDGTESDNEDRTDQQCNDQREEHCLQVIHGNCSQGTEAD